MPPSRLPDRASSLRTRPGRRFACRANTPRLFAKSRDDRGEALDREVDFLWRGETSEAEADRAMGQGLAQAHGQKDMAGGHAGAGARRAGADGDVVQGVEKGIAIDAGEGNVGDVRQE